MPGSRLFSTYGALTPSAPAFSEEVYSVALSKRDIAYAPTSLYPRVICSPHLTGKTTQLNFLASRFIGTDFRVSIEFSDDASRFREEDLRQFLGERLNSSSRSTLRDILLSSEILRVSSKGVSILALINVEKLQDRVLRWLLGGVRKLAEEDGGVLATRRIHVLIDGSFSVQTLTAGPNSDFPLPQIYPPEFDRDSQRSFVSRRLHLINIELSDEAYDLLRAETDGDKYLTQEVSLRLASHLGFPSTLTTANRSGVEACMNELIEARLTDYELGRSLGRGLIELLGFMDGNISAIVDLVENLRTRWQSLPQEVRASIYKSGLIRRVGETEVVTRAPMVRKIALRALDRLEVTRETLKLHFDYGGVADSEKGKAFEVINSIEGEAVYGTLKALHAGYGRKVGENRLSGEMHALGLGDYEAEWDLDMGRQVADGQEVWVLLWVAEPEFGVRESHLRIFGVRAERLLP